MMMTQPKPIEDIRTTADESATVSDGMLYRKGGVVQVWWERDVLGRPFTGEQGRETWILDDSEWGIMEAKRNYENMKERFRE